MTTTNKSDDDQHVHHDHDHHSHDGHNHAHVPKELRALVTVLGFTAVIFFAELIGGWYSGSLALISDAMHMLSDSTGLVVAATAIVFARQAASKSATYGNKRLEVVAALINAVSVSAISVWIVLEAFERLRSAAVVNTTMMLVVGVIGLVANVFGAVILRGHAHNNLNLKGAYLHVLVDLCGSIAVIIAAIVMKITGITWADTVASLLIAALILPRAIKLAWQSLQVLLEHAPAGIDSTMVAKQLLALPQVHAVHDLHIWSLNGQDLLATCHVVIDDTINTAACGVLDQVQRVLADCGIEHSTVQLESQAHGEHEQVCNN